MNSKGEIYGDRNMTIEHEILEKHREAVRQEEFDRIKESTIEKAEDELGLVIDRHQLQPFIYLMIETGGAPLPCRLTPKTASIIVPYLTEAEAKAIRKKLDNGKLRRFFHVDNKDENLQQYYEAFRSHLGSLDLAVESFLCQMETPIGSHTIVYVQNKWIYETYLQTEDNKGKEMCEIDPVEKSLRIFEIMNPNKPMNCRNFFEMMDYLAIDLSAKSMGLGGFEVAVPRIADRARGFKLASFLDRRITDDETHPCQNRFESISSVGAVKRELETTYNGDAKRAVIYTVPITALGSGELSGILVHDGLCDN